MFGITASTCRCCNGLYWLLLTVRIFLLCEAWILRSGLNRLGEGDSITRGCTVEKARFDNILVDSMFCDTLFQQCCVSLSISFNSLSPTHVATEGKCILRLHRQDLQCNDVVTHLDWDHRFLSWWLQWWCFQNKRRVGNKFTMERENIWIAVRVPTWWNLKHARRAFIKV